MGTRSSAYPSLAAFTDANQRQAIKLIYDKIQSLEQRAAASADALESIPASVSPEEMREYVLQQVATLRATPTPATYPVVEGIPGTPNTIPSDALPLPASSGVVAGVFAANPGFVATSCQSDPGGTWDLMDAIVDALRAADGPRWGYNGKRGDVNDPSRDALAYDYDPLGPGGEGSTTVYIVDVIAGHCGPTPGPAFNDVTVFAPGAFTGRGRF